MKDEGLVAEEFVDEYGNEKKRLQMPWDGDVVRDGSVRASSGGKFF